MRGRNEEIARIEEAAAAITAGELDGTVGMIELFLGADEQGRCFWAYVAVVPSRYGAYRSALAAGGSVVLDDFGCVLEAGCGVLPPAGVQRRWAEEGFDAGFESSMTGIFGGAERR